MSSIPFPLTWILPVLLIVFNLIVPGVENLNGKMEIVPNLNYIIDYQQSQAEGTSSATGTLIFNLPIVEQNVPTSTPVPLDNYPAPDSGIELPPGTPTPTPIPVQTGSANVPIVIGALAIITVILLAWFFVGYLPSRIKGQSP